jgi:hypothetical protein
MPRLALLFALVSLVAVACTKEPEKSDAAPVAEDKDPTEMMVAHSRAMLRIVQDNLSDCSGLVSKLRAYVKKHDAEFKRIQQRTKELEASMTPEEQGQYAKDMMKVVGTMFKESMQVLLQASQSCPDRVAEIRELMKKVAM